MTNDPNPAWQPPPPQPYPQQPFPQQPPPKQSFRQRRPKTFWALTIIGGLVLVGIISSIVNPPKSDPAATAAPTSSSSTAPAPQAPATKAGSKQTSAAPAPAPAKQAPVVFDIPTGKKLTKLELHDSAFSGGAEVPL